MYFISLEETFARLFSKCNATTDREKLKYFNTKTHQKSKNHIKSKLLVESRKLALA